MSLHLECSRGSIYLVGQQIENFCKAYADHLLTENFLHAIENRKERDGCDHHLTLIHKSEFFQMNAEAKQIVEDYQTVSECLHVLGVGEVKEKDDFSVFLVIYWPNGQAIRKDLGLQLSTFHVTLGFSSVDIHEKNKGVSSLILFPTRETLILNLEAMKRFGDDEMLIAYSSKAIFLDDEIRKLRAESFFALKQYACCINEIESWSMSSLPIDLLFRKVECHYLLADYDKALVNIWNLVFTFPGEPKERIVKALVRLQLKLGSIRIDHSTSEAKRFDVFDRKLYFDLINQVITNQDDTLLRLPRISPLDIRYFVFDGDASHKLARNFSWVVPHTLAGMSTPRNLQDIRALAPIGIKLVVTLTEEEPLDPTWFDESIQNLFMPVPNYHPPSVEQVDEILYQIAKRHSTRNGAVLVHCGGGKGRAGSVLAAYLLAFGLKSCLNLCAECQMDPVQVGTCSNEECCFRQTPSFSGPEAIDFLRKMRPESLETEKQEAFIRSYCSILWKRYSNDPVERIPISGFSNGLRIDGVHQEAPQIMFLVGLPGSGKSWFASQLTERFPEKFVRVNQDEIGGRSSTEDAFSHHAKQGKKVVILDRCNATIEDRKWFMKLAVNAKYAVAVHFDVSAEVCAKRIARRFDHETIKAGRGDNAINHFVKCMQIPTRGEGLSTIYTISGFKDVQDLIEMFDSTKTVTNFVKFPRTTHLVNFGGASRDDLVFSDADVKNFLTVKPGFSLTMEEKIDGANLGFSMENGEIKAQNRSHYVHSKYHPQFCQLSNWIYQHQTDLRTILGEDGEKILFGEWMYAKHSIHYTKLPDLFIAFDIYDVKAKKFLSRSKFREALKDTSIHVVQELKPSKLPQTSEDIASMLKQTSSFSDQPIEGVYFRIDKETAGWLKERAKAVRSDFICGNEHWSKGILTLNTINKF